MTNQKATETFHHLLETVDALLDPKSGCPWDRKQTFESLRQYILEEVYEVIDAVDAGDVKNLAEELGDLLFNVVFFAKLGEKEGAFTATDVVEVIYDKLIVRHPHIFGETTDLTPDQVVAQWEAIKKQEKKERTSALDGIPAHLPALSRASQIAKALKEKKESTLDEIECGMALYELVLQARGQSIDPEIALRAYLRSKEEEIYKREQAQGA